MNKFLIGAALVLLSASAHAETYHVDGVTISVPTHCASSSCVSVDAPGYGYHHQGKRAKAHTDRKEIKTAAVAKKGDRLDTPSTTEATPAAAPAPVAEVTPAKAPETSTAPAADTASK